MNEQIMVGNPPIEITLRHNPRARRYNLRISNRDGAVKLTVPYGGDRAGAFEFAQSQEGWLRKHLIKVQPGRIVGVGASVLLDGEMVRVDIGGGRSPRVEDGVLRVSGREDTAAARVRGFYKTLARERMLTASEAYAAALGKSFAAISIRDTKSRWGSCTSDGRLMYSWRLMMAPRNVQDYVAAHEVSHLVELNHSPAYWAVVDSIFPEYQEARRWLKRNGSYLQSFQF